MDISKLSRPRFDLTLIVYIPILLLLTLALWLDRNIFEHTIYFGQWLIFISLTGAFIGFAKFRLGTSPRRSKSTTLLLTLIHQLNQAIFYIIVFALFHTLTHQSSLSQALNQVILSNTLYTPWPWLIYIFFIILFALMKFNYQTIPSACNCILPTMSHTIRQTLGLSANYYLRQSLYIGYTTCGIVITLALFTIALEYYHIPFQFGLNAHTFFLFIIFFMFYISDNLQKILQYFIKFKLSLSIITFIICAGLLSFLLLFYVVIASFQFHLSYEFKPLDILSTHATHAPTYFQYLIPLSLTPLFALRNVDYYQGHSLGYALITHCFFPCLIIGFYPHFIPWFSYLAEKFIELFLIYTTFYYFYLSSSTKAYELFFSNNYVFGITDKPRLPTTQLKSLCMSFIGGSILFLTYALGPYSISLYLFIAPFVLILFVMSMTLTTNLKRARLS